MPYINRPYRSRPWYLERISRYSDPPEDSPPQTNFVVNLAPFPSHFTPDGRAVFPLSKRKDSIRINKMEIRPNTIIYATGYTQEFPYFDQKSGYPIPKDADLRNVAKTGDESIAFIGYVRPGVGKLFMAPSLRMFQINFPMLGAIPPLAEMQAFFWISLLKKQVKLPLSPPHYHLLTPENARIQYGVDHSTYMSTLAKDIKAAPGLVQLWSSYGTKVLVCYW